MDGTKRHEDYTVGIVCAIPYEMCPVRNMLDRTHPNLKPKSDSKITYLLGEMSGHNIVVDCLPGTQGNSAAAFLARDMHVSFPAIKWLFMSGIGGGVPTKHDIRLGDVVVGMPDGEYGGVVQYDLGKAMGNRFERKGCLLPPPTELRSAITEMRSENNGVAQRINRYVMEMIVKDPELSQYARPAADSDILFETSSLHVAGSQNCDNCGQGGVVARVSRKSNAPTVHYGLIASGNTVMKSATKRDLAVRDIGDVLCFEMEAAGITTEFPCLVVRGICDYADTHKNDIWHHHAAAVAAAFIKELLTRLASSRPQDDQTLAKEPSDANQHVGSHIFSVEKGMLLNGGTNNLSGNFNWG
jgi:nucleoside phosphorylase